MNIRCLRFRIEFIKRFFLRNLLPQSPIAEILRVATSSPDITCIIIDFVVYAINCEKNSYFYLISNKNNAKNLNLFIICNYKLFLGYFCCILYYRSQTRATISPMYVSKK
uniref:Uncharacterized protein n=1 Tax=Heterorhabditis bacteriophora TaxID=37862 RepID=A0A1I7WFJ3_HETBA